MIRTTTSQDKEFINEVLPWNLLEVSMQYIADNFEPEEVFGDKRMKEFAQDWAENNGYIKDLEL